MIKLKDFLEAIDFKITGGDRYLWHCFGKHARIIDSEYLGEYSASVVFDTMDQKVYSVEIHDYRKDKSFRMIHPSFVDQYQQECEDRDIDFAIAWDDHEFIDLHFEEDILEKIIAIVNDEPYDDRVGLDLNLSNDVILVLALEAHKRDITLNDYICEILEDDLNYWLTFESD